MVEFLLKKGAKIDIKTKIEEYTPIFLAVLRNHQEMVELLLKNGSKLTHYSKKTGSLLHACAFNNNVELAKYFLDLNYNIDNNDNRFGFTPLHVAVKENSYEMIEFLIKNGANLKSKTKSEFKEKKTLLKSGSTPLELAKAYNNQRVIELINNVKVK